MGVFSGQDCGGPVSGSGSLRLLVSSVVKAAGSSCSSLLPMGGSSNFGHLSWCQVWCPSTQSSSGARILGSGTCGTTIVPGAWGIGTLAAVVVLVSEVQARANLLGTGLCIFGAFCSD